MSVFQDFDTMLRKYKHTVDEGQGSDARAARFVYILLIWYLCFKKKHNKHNAELRRADPGTKVTGEGRRDLTNRMFLQSQHGAEIF